MTMEQEMMEMQEIIMETKKVKIATRKQKTKKKQMDFATKIRLYINCCDTEKISIWSHIDIVSVFKNVNIFRI